MHCSIFRPATFFFAILVAIMLTQCVVAQNQGAQNQGARNPGYPNSPVRLVDNRRAAPPQNVGPRGPLSEREAKYIDDVLKYWQFSSDKIKRYRSNFERLEYDPGWGPRNAAKTISRGIIKYAKPDKGLFKVDEIFHYQAPAKPGDKPKYVRNPGETGEHWVCDGESIFEFDAKKKQVIQRTLPPEMRGKAIANGPLPFMFGAKAATLKQRYWFYVTTPKDSKGEYWLMAYPKTREDAANFKMVEIILDEKDFLPKAIQIFDRNFNPRTNPSRSVFTFDKREINPFVDNFQKLNLFHREFFEPATPKGWKRVVEKSPAPAPPANRPPQNGPPNNQAGRGGNFQFQRR